jgi:hypothetical protein
MLLSKLVVCKTKSYASPADVPPRALRHAYRSFFATVLLRQYLEIETKLLDVPNWKEELDFFPSFPETTLKFASQMPTRG